MTMFARNCSTPAIEAGAGASYESQWQTASLGDCALLVRQSVTPAEMGNTPYVGLEHIGEGTLSLIGQGDASQVTSAKMMFQSGDILFGKLRPYFRKVVRAPSDGICSTDIWVVRAAPGVDQSYLYYCMASEEFVRFATGGAEGTKMPRAIWEYVSRFEVQLPPLPEQRRIAEILGALDDKIELNRQMNETLEQMASALFKSWFVDFEPVCAKMDGRWQYGQSLPGLPAELYDLFPDRFAPSELGEIPEGWTVKPLGDCYNLTMGQSPPGSTYNEDGKGLPFFQGNVDFGFRYPSNRRYCTAPTRTANPDDTLVSVRAPVGAINMAWERCCIGRGLAALRHKSGSSSFTYHAVEAAQREIQQYEHTGTVFGAINRRQFEALQMLEPPPDAVEMFENLVAAADKRIRCNVAASRTLVRLRDGLIPKLVAGKLQASAVSELRAEQG